MTRTETAFRREVAKVSPLAILIVQRGTDVVQVDFLGLVSLYVVLGDRHVILNSIDL